MILGIWDDDATGPPLMTSDVKFTTLRYNLTDWDLPLRHEITMLVKY